MGQIWSSPQRPPRNERVVVITGCDTGFGHSAAIQLDLLGYIVYAGCLTEAGQENLKSQLSSRSSVVLYNVTKEEDHARVAADIEAKHPGGIYALVCNAGIFTVSPAEWEPMRDIRNIFEVNFFGMVQTVKAFLPSLHKSHGRIVILASAASRFALQDWSSYSATKHAVAAYGDSLRREMRHFGIQVILLEPGWTKTPLLDGFKEHYFRNFAALPDETKALYGSNYAQQRSNLYLHFLNNAANPKYVVKSIVRSIEVRPFNTNYDVTF